MALVKCRECKKDVSSEAVLCPHCGIASPGRVEATPKKSGDPTSQRSIVPLIAVGALGIGLFYFFTREPVDGYRASPSAEPIKAAAATTAPAASTPPQPTKEPESASLFKQGGPIEASLLFDVFLRFKNSAKHYYVGKPTIVTGKVNSIDRTKGKVSIVLGSAKRTGGFVEVLCEPSMPGIKTAKVGQPFKVLCVPDRLYGPVLAHGLMAEK